MRGRERERPASPPAEQVRNETSERPPTLELVTTHIVATGLRVKLWITQVRTLWHQAELIPEKIEGKAHKTGEKIHDAKTVLYEDGTTRLPVTSEAEVLRAEKGSDPTKKLEADLKDMKTSWESNTRMLVGYLEQGELQNRFDEGVERLIIQLKAYSNSEIIEQQERAVEIVELVQQVVGESRAGLRNPEDTLARTREIHGYVEQVLIHLDGAIIALRQVEEEVAGFVAEGEANEKSAKLKRSRKIAPSVHRIAELSDERARALEELRSFSTVLHISIEELQKFVAHATNISNATGIHANSRFKLDEGEQMLTQMREKRQPMYDAQKEAERIKKKLKAYTRKSTNSKKAA